VINDNKIAITGAIELLFAYLYIISVNFPL